MKKCILLLTVIGCFLAGCDNEIYRWEFSYECDYVKGIYIVEAEDAYTYSHIKEIDIKQVEEVYADISNLDMKRYGPISSLGTPYGICIVVMFHNGEYDIIARKESMHIKLEEDRLIGYTSWLYCDNEQFDALIEKYA